jgi:hypothetical protein
MKHATHAETKTTRRSRPKSSQIRQRCSRSVAKSVRRSAGELIVMWSPDGGEGSRSLTLRVWFQLLEQW